MTSIKLNKRADGYRPEIQGILITAEGESMQVVDLKSVKDGASLSAHFSCETTAAAAHCVDVHVHCVIRQKSAIVSAANLTYSILRFHDLRAGIDGLKRTEIAAFVDLPEGK